jgi:hypothetical protein
MSLILSFTVAAMVCCGVFLLPGLALLRRAGGAGGLRSAVDGFWLGWAFVSLVALTLAPWFELTQSYVVGLRIALLVCAIGSIALIRRAAAPDRSAAARFRSGLAGLTALLLVLVAVHVATHSIGYDESAHFDYLDMVQSNAPFEKHHTIGGAVKIARYPLFGIAVVGMGSWYPAGLFCTYYAMGFLILLGLVLKMFQWSAGSRLDWAGQSALISLILLFLAFGGHDSYLNFGLYPLQQAKLIYLVGLGYCLKGIGPETGTAGFWLGFVLLVLSVFYHPNLALLAAPTLMLLVPLAVWHRRKTKGFLRTLFICLAGLPLILAPAAIGIRSGICDFGPASAAGSGPPQQLHDQQPTPPAPDEQTVTIPPENGGNQTSAPAGKVDIEAAGTHVEKNGISHLTWIQRSKFRLMRVFNPEPLLFLLFIVAAPRLVAIRWVAVPVLATTAILIATLTTANVCRQALSATTYSGVFWMVRDIGGAASSLIPGRTYWSDPYTALYLRILHRLDARPLPLKEEIVAFTPLFRRGAEYWAAEMVGAREADQLVVNVRFWGDGVAKRFDKGAAGLAAVQQAISRFGFDGSPYYLKKAILGWVAYYRSRLSFPVAVVAFGPKPAAAQSMASESSLVAGSTQKIYRDAALMRVDDIQAGEVLRFNFQYDGDGMVIRGHSSLDLLRDFKPLVTYDSRYKNDAIVIQAIVPQDTFYLMFRVIGSGNFGGLGTMNAIELDRRLTGG